MIGHAKIIADLKGLHERGALSHGYIFYGPSMVGKRLAARSFANFLEKGEFVYNEDAVLSDLMLVEPGENGSIGIDAVREIRNFLWQKPNASTRRTLIIDHAELLTTEAQNALLKLTEEPPVSSLLILVTSDVESILPTIVSRLPKIYFGAVPEKEIAAWLAESTEEKKMTVAGAKKQAADFAKKAMGKPGLAWRLLNDKEFQKQVELAEKLLKTPVATRRDLIKKIIDPDEFSFRKFLDAVVINLAWQEAASAQSATKKNNTALWHRALQLYDRETNFSLNPRLQLESLLS
jgi:DNA polymerase-3 subunit delta'